MIAKYEDNNLKNEYPIPEASYADLYNMGFWDHKVAKLTLVWREDISKNKQIVLLKKLYPKINELSISKLYDIVQKNKSQWQFAEMGWGNAIDFAEEAKILGLNILVEDNGVV